MSRELSKKFQMQQLIEQFKTMDYYQRNFLLEELQNLNNGLNNNYDLDHKSPDELLTISSKLKKNIEDYQTNLRISGEDNTEESKKLARKYESINENSPQKQCKKLRKIEAEYANIYAESQGDLCNMETIRIFDDWPDVFYGETDDLDFVIAYSDDCYIVHRFTNQDMDYDNESRKLNRSQCRQLGIKYPGYIRSIHH